MDIMDKKGIKDHYIVLDNALIGPRWLEEWLKKEATNACIYHPIHPF